MSQLLRIFSLALVWLPGSSVAFGNCVQDRRPIKVEDRVIQLRTYVCERGEGPNSARVRVEIDRLSDTGASVTLAQQRSELTGVIGSPKLIGNAVSEAYSEIIRQFGETWGRGRLERLKVEAAGSGGKTLLLGGGASRPSSVSLGRAWSLPSHRGTRCSTKKDNSYGPQLFLRR